MQDRDQTKVATVRRGKYLVEVTVHVVYSEHDPDEPVLTPEAALLLDEVARRATAGDLAWLKQHGKVFELVEA
jgi:hypothetical protein